jgi:hypothetical protein
MKGRLFMKKTLLALLVLTIAGTAMGTVKVKITRTADANKVNIGYTWVTPGEKLRALGLQVTVSKAAYVLNSATRVGNDFYVTPFNITFAVVDGNTVIDQLGSPAVSQTTGGFVLETASLYDPLDPLHPSPPPNDANVVMLGLNCALLPNNTDPCKFGTVDVSISATATAAALRGGIVLEDGNSVTPILSPSTYVPPKLSFCRTTHPYWLCPGQPSGDTNGNGTADSTDYFNFKKAYGTSRLTIPPSPRGTGVGQYNCACDFDHNGKVDSSDYFIFKQNYGRTGMGTCPTALKSCP